MFNYLFSRSLEYSDCDYHDLIPMLHGNDLFEPAKHSEQIRHLSRNRVVLDCETILLLSKIILNEMHTARQREVHSPGSRLRQFCLHECTHMRIVTVFERSHSTQIVASIIVTQQAHTATVCTRCTRCCPGCRAAHRKRSNAIGPAESFAT